jgi:hypothetical protein
MEYNKGEGGFTFRELFGIRKDDEWIVSNTKRSMEDLKDKDREMNIIFTESMVKMFEEKGVAFLAMVSGLGFNDCITLLTAFFFQMGYLKGKWDEEEDKKLEALMGGK